jgi:hypothetical protein
MPEIDVDDCINTLEEYPISPNNHSISSRSVSGNARNHKVLDSMVSSWKSWDIFPDSFK